MRWTLVPKASLVVASWRNGLGVSREIAHATGWSVSIADLERDSAFSVYPGMDRLFTPISGATPPELAFDGGPLEPCPLLVPRPFPGDVPTIAHITSPGQAFNVIVKRGAFRPEVAVARLETGQGQAVPEAPVVVVHCLSGTLELAGLRLGSGDSAVADEAVPPEMLVATAGGIAIVASIRPREPQPR